MAYVLSKNLHRRHLNESQRAMVAARVANMPSGARTDLASIDARSQPEAAAALNVSRPSVQRAARVQTSGTPELVRAVDEGRVAVSAAAKIAEHPAERQSAILEMVERGEARDVKDADRKLEKRQGALTIETPRGLNV